MYLITVFQLFLRTLWIMICYIESNHKAKFWLAIVFIMFMLHKSEWKKKNSNNVCLWQNMYTFCIRTWCLIILEFLYINRTTWKSVDQQVFIYKFAECWLPLFALQNHVQTFINTGMYENFTPLANVWSFTTLLNLTSSVTSISSQ